MGTIPKRNINQIEEMLKLANKVAEIVQEEYGWRYEKCFSVALTSKWFIDNRMTVDEIVQTNPQEVYAIVRQQIESCEII